MDFIFNFCREVIKKVLYYSYCDEMVEIFARDVLKCILNDEEEVLLDDDSKASLSLIFRDNIEKVSIFLSLYICRPERE